MVARNKNKQKFKSFKVFFVNTTSSFLANDKIEYMFKLFINF